MHLNKPVLLGFLFFLTPFFATTYTGNIYDRMNIDNSRTVKEKESSQEKTPSRRTFSQILKKTLREQQNLSPAKKRRLVYKLLSDYEKQNPSKLSTVLDTTSWQDLEMLSGPKSNISHYLGIKIDQTATETGRITFFKKLIQPRCDLDYLHKNQTILKELVNNESLFLDIDHHLQRLKQTENLILCLWEEDIYESILKQSGLSIPYAPDASEWMDRSTLLVEFINTGRLASLICTNAAKAAAAIILPIQGIACLQGSSLNDTIKKWTPALQGVSILSVTGLILSTLKTKFPSNKQLEGFSDVVVGPVGGVDVLYLEDQLRNEAAFKKGLQTKLIAVAQYIDSLKQLSKITQNNPVLLKEFPAITTVAQDLEILSKKSVEIKQLLGLLETSTFKGKPRLFSLYGPMYVSYKILTNKKHEFVPFMVRSGELDAYLSCAKLMKKFQNHRVHFCFPQYVTNVNRPFVQGENFWNPAIDAEKVVPSSLTIGHQAKPNIIVTGPNAGGKSTVIKGLILNVIMSQSLGIAAARSFTLTPFKNIITYLNITDDIAAGNSHFKAGVLRAKELIKTAEKQTGNDFSFTAVDEVFNGTSHEEGQAAAYSLIEQLGNYRNNMCVTITHFPKVSLLENRTNNFTNYRVTVQKDSQGRISYPYRLEKGIINQSIAIDILKQEGFGDTFLKKAQQILKES